MSRRLTAASHLEAYDLFARHSADPALMANRDGQTTKWKMERIIAQLPLASETRFLDVGPGDGALIAAVAPRVATCLGVDPSGVAVERLNGLHVGLDTVSFAVGTSQRIDVPDESFDVVVINSVLHILPALEEVRRSLRELVRVCRPGGVIFVGELPFRSELARGVLRHMSRKLWEYGPRPYARLLFDVYARPWLRGEPTILHPIGNLHVPEEELRGWCAELGVDVVVRRHHEPRRPSLTRNDYVLRRSSP